MAPKIGLALGSGAARGWAHIGVLRGLAEMGIEPDLIAGTSMGACVGAAHLVDRLDDMRDWADRMGLIGVLGLIDLTFRRGGLVVPAKVFERFDFAAEIQIESLPKPFAAVACDLGTGREVWLRSGPLLDAARASAALPGLFPPVRHKDRWLTDGGLVNPVPVSVCRAMGAEVVIAVDLNAEPAAPKPRRAAVETDAAAGLVRRVGALFGWKPDPRTRLLAGQFAERTRDAPGVLEVIAGSIDIMQDRITRSRLAGEPPDALIQPRLGGVGILDFDRAEEAIAIGLEAVRIATPGIELAIRRAA